MIKQAIAALTAGRNLDSGAMEAIIRTIMGGEAEPAAVGALLTALAIKGETVEEITAAAKVMRSFAKQVALETDEILVDPVGTGGDGACLFNVSTASAIIASAAGVKVAKHGSIAASSSSGSADLLREAGVKLELTPEQIKASIAACGFGFMYAPAFHAAMKNVVPIRKAIGIRTVFNLLGPLCNPAGVKYQVLGVFSKKWVRPMAETAKALGAKRIITVCADNGLDEFSAVCPNTVCELREDGVLTEYVINPKDFGINHAEHGALKVTSAAESLALIQNIFSTGKPAVGLDMLALNTAAIFLVSGKSANWEDGIALAKEIMQSGAAARQLASIAAVSRSFGA